MNAQALGLVLLGVGFTLLWSAWALVIAGALLLVAPEVAAVVRRVRS